MKLLDRYIFKTVASTTLVVVLVMLSLDIFFNLLREVEHLGEGSYGMFVIVQYLGLTLPRRIYEILPMALLVGGLLGMGTLANGSELVIMRTAGLSIFRLVLAALKAGLVLSVVVFVMGEFIAPYTELLAQQLRAEAREKQLSFSSGRGFWARDGNFFVNVNGVKSGFRLVDIYIYEVDENSNLKSVTRAQSAKYADDHWVLEGVKRSQIEPDAVATDVVANIAWESIINPEMLQVLATDPEDLSIRDLRTFISYLEANRLDTQTYELTAWTKLIAPFTNLTMLIIAMPFVFGSQRKAGFGQRILVGILLGLLFFLANRLLSNMVLLYGIHPAVGASLPTLLFFLAGGFALQRMR